MNREIRCLISEQIDIVVEREEILNEMYVNTDYDRCCQLRERFDQLQYRDWQIFQRLLNIKHEAVQP